MKRIRRNRSAAAERMPPGADLATLRVWAEWRRQRMTIKELAKRAGHSAGRVRALLSGTATTRNRALVVADLAQVLGIVAATPARVYTAAGSKNGAARSGASTPAPGLTINPVHAR